MSRFVLITALTTSLFAQQLAFEAASIRILPDMDRSHGVGGKPSGSRLRLENQTLERLICFSYNVKRWQVAEGPEWATVSRGGKPMTAQTIFEINAKAEGESAHPIEDFRLMMQSLLSDRFHLAIHRETRPVRVYALTVDKSGLKMKPGIPPQKGGAMSVSMGPGGASMSARGTTVDSLLNYFLNSGVVDRAVVDRTGLTDSYDFKIDYTVSGPGDSGDLSALDIFSALPLQLGLRLTPDTVPMEVIVIDHAQLPTEN